MRVRQTDIPGVLLIEPLVHGDERGFFMETYQKQRYWDAGVAYEMVQDNHSRSRKGTLRGLHYQVNRPQGKLLRVVAGEIFDVAVDLRRKSPTFGRWTSARLSEGNRYQFFVPPGMAHGFCVLSDFAELEYKCTDVYFPEYERSLAWDDPTLAIGWPVKDPLLSKRDSRGSAFGSDPYYEDMGA